MLATKKEPRSYERGSSKLLLIGGVCQLATEETGEQGFYINTEGFAQSLRNLSDILDNVARQLAGVITEHHNLVNIGVRLTGSLSNSSLRREDLAYKIYKTQGYRHN